MNEYIKPTVQSYSKKDIVQNIINAASCPVGTTFTCGTGTSF